MMDLSRILYKGQHTVPGLSVSGPMGGCPQDTSDSLLLNSVPAPGKRHPQFTSCQRELPLAFLLSPCQPPGSRNTWEHKNKIKKRAGHPRKQNETWAAWTFKCGTWLWLSVNMGNDRSFWTERREGRKSQVGTGEGLHREPEWLCYHRLAASCVLVWAPCFI